VFLGVLLKDMTNKRNLSDLKFVDKIKNWVKKYKDNKKYEQYLTDLKNL
jgi:hypothetical protein